MLDMADIGLQTDVGKFQGIFAAHFFLPPPFTQRFCLLLLALQCCEPAFLLSLLLLHEGIKSAENFLAYLNMSQTFLIFLLVCAVAVDARELSGLPGFRTSQMGYNSWYDVMMSPSSTALLATAEAMASNGLQVSICNSISLCRAIIFDPLSIFSSLPLLSPCTGCRIYLCESGRWHCRGESWP